MGGSEAGQDAGKSLTRLAAAMAIATTWCIVQLQGPRNGEFFGRQLTLASGHACWERWAWELSGQLGAWQAVLGVQQWHAVQSEGATTEAGGQALDVGRDLWC